MEDVRTQVSETPNIASRPRHNDDDNLDNTNYSHPRAESDWSSVALLDPVDTQESMTKSESQEFIRDPNPSAE